MQSGGVEQVLWPFNLPSPAKIRRPSLTQFTQILEDLPSLQNGGKMSKPSRHCGYIELAKPVFHVGLITETLAVLECVCFYCSRLLVNPNHPNIQEILLKTKHRPRERLNLILDVCKTVDICKERDQTCTSSNCHDSNSIHEEKSDHVGCGRYQPKYTYKGWEIEAEWKNENHQDSPKNLSFNAEHVYEIFKHIRDEECIVLGIDSNIVRPEWMIITVLSVPSLTEEQAENQTFRDGLTKNINAIIQCNNQLLKNEHNGTDTQIVAENIKMLHFYVTKVMSCRMQELPGPWQKMLSTAETWNSKTITHPAISSESNPCSQPESSSVHRTWEKSKDEREEKISEIGMALLGVDNITLENNFVELGGDSLLISQMVSRLREAEVTTTLHEVFTAPTLATISSPELSAEFFHVPPNLIEQGSAIISPDMLPLIELSPNNIEAIVSQTPGGISNIQDIYGLTPMQQGLLYHHIIERNGDPYVLMTQVHFDDEDAVHNYVAAFQKVIERHDILRTAFIWEDLNEPAQIVLRKVPSVLNKVTLDKTGGDILKPLKLKFDSRQCQLDLTQPPLYRLVIASDNNGGWVALQFLHHLIFDQSSIDILHIEVKEIMTKSKNVLKNPTPFRNLVAEARLRVGFDEYTTFFTKMLASVDEPTLPFNLDNAPGDETNMSETECLLPQELNTSLREQAKRLGVSLASLCHLAFAQCLASSCGREKVIFGTVLSCRSLGKEKNCSSLGLWINTLPLLLDVNQTSVERAIQDTHSRLQALLQYKHTPLALAQHCSGVKAPRPLFNALFNYRHREIVNQVSFPGVNISATKGWTSFPLTISVDDYRSGLKLTAQVVAPILANRVCAYMHEALSSLNDTLIHNSSRPLRSLCVVPKSEQKLLLETWNESPINYSLRSCCIHQLVEAQAEKDSNAIALEFGSEALSYAELNTAANRLAHHLIKQGVKPDTRIVLCLTRSFNMIVAILGVFKAGGAYIPLDPTYPCERLNNVLEDAEPAWLLVDEIGQAALGVTKIPTINLDKPLPGKLSTQNPQTFTAHSNRNHLAYIIYTSGSTGRPKGVMIEHRNLTRLFDTTQGIFKFSKQDKWCLFHSFSFDVSVWEMWGALHVGGQLLILPHDISRSALNLYKWVCNSNVNILCQTPSAFKIFMQGKDDTLQSNTLRCVILAGEALDSSILENLSEKYAESKIRFFNVYGPTENTVYTTWYELNLQKVNDYIGRPLPDVKIYLLDPWGKPVPLGAVGEIFIGGAGVARGYYNRPELTVKHFLSDPFSTTLGARMYRTGDLAQYHTDGNLKYLGRIDNQVKIRGYRIELGEIETCLIKHPQVKNVVLMARDDGKEKRLVAYVVPELDIISPHDLREHLSTILPDYMIPAAFVSLPELPLTPNGKLDYKSLPIPDDDAFAIIAYEAPQGEIEEKLARIWSSLLGIAHISRHDNFFTLGGHSLLVMQMLAHLRQYGLSTDVLAVYDTPTLSLLGLTVREYHPTNFPTILIKADSTIITPEILPLITLSQSDINEIVAKVPGGVSNIQDIYRLVPLQQGILYQYITAKTGDPYLLKTTLIFTDKDSLDNYTTALQQVVERHDALRTLFLWEKLNEPAQVVLRKVEIVVSEVKLTNAPGQISSRFDTQNFSFNVSQAPLLHLLVAFDSDIGWVGLQLLHHLIIDQISLDTLQAEVQALMMGRRDDLKTPIPFRNLVAQTCFDNNLEEHKNMQFFSEMLADVQSPTLPFGSDIFTKDVAGVIEAEIQLPHTLHYSLRMHARRLRVSLSSLCHLAFAQFLACSSGNENVVFGTVLFGRLENVDKDGNALGLWINTLPLKLDLNKKTVENAVQDVHDRLSVLLAHEHATLAVAQRFSGVPKSLPLFCALFNYRHKRKTEEILLPGVQIIGTQGWTNYPLTVSLDDTEDNLKVSVQIIPPYSADRVCSYIQETLSSLNDALLHDPKWPVQNLTVVPRSERQLQLKTLKESSIAYSTSDCCIHHLFETQVKLHGESTAVEFETETMTYMELNTRANVLAHSLMKQGVKPDDRVALCMTQGPNMFIAILGTLKAGAAYVPLDPSYSCKRLNYILSNADPSLLLVDDVGHEVLGTHQVPTINLSRPLPSKGFLNKDTQPFQQELSPSNLAYIIYTSGSTGLPKGVMVEHRQVIRLLDVGQELFRFNRQDRWCLFHSFSFDFSVWEIWGALGNAGVLLLKPNNISRSSNNFYEWVCNSGITVLCQTPSAFKIFVQAKTDTLEPRKLRYVFFGGEALDSSTIEKWYTKTTDKSTTLINMYGTTETTVHATFHKIESHKFNDSIGRSLPGVNLYVLGKNGDMVPFGAEGEIYIGGFGVTRGYLQRPELTAKYFLKDFFNTSLNSKMYRTGDLARYHFDGTLIYLGRIDDQVKIRGYRIEPAEIESNLCKHPDIHEAVVRLKRNGSEKSLIAYLVPKHNDLLPDEIRNYLLTLLPDYMIPSAFVSLSKLPLNANGKLDLRALPDADEGAIARKSYEAPHGEIEEKLATVWSEILGITHIGRNDNFFALGGHSLLVVQMLAMLRQFKLITSVRAIFEASTLSALALTTEDYHAIDIPANLISLDCEKITPEMLPLIELSQSDIDTITELVPGGVSNIQDIYSLAPLQHGILFHHMMAKQGDPYLLVTYLHFSNREIVDTYVSALQQVIERHDVLRSAFVWEGLSKPAQVVWRKVSSLLSEIILDGSTASALEQLKNEFDPSHYQVDLTKAPLLRLTILPDPSGGWIAVQLLHHLISDHYTLENINTEVQTIMTGYHGSLKTSIPFRNFVAQAYLNDNADVHINFFTSMLGDIHAPTLPMDLSNIHLDGGKINEATYYLEKELNDNLRSQARHWRVSLASLCHIAFARFLSSASGLHDVVFGTVLIGRMQSEKKDKIALGLCINTLPLRLTIDETTVKDIVQKAHSQISLLLGHEHAILARAQKCSQVPDSQPLFSALFNYRHNSPMTHTSNLGVNLLEFKERTNYPLTFSVNDDGNSLMLTAQVSSPISAQRVCAYMNQTLTSLNDALMNEPNRSVQNLSVIPQSERELILKTWNNNCTDIYSSSKRCIHHLFETQVECNGEAIAVEFEGEVLTYKDLNSRANELAHLLIQKGIKPETRVALCVTRGPTMIVAILGILKAGAAYVPLDPMYTSKRLTYILTDANPAYLLADEFGQAALGDHRVPTINLDQLSTEGLSTNNPQSVGIEPTLKNLAYVIYTSGSTGSPKGVMVEHEQLTRLFDYTQGLFEFSQQDKWCLFHSVSFDFSVWEIWGALRNGGQLAIVSDSVIRSSYDFYEWTCNSGITVLNQTPSAFKMFLQAKNVSLARDKLRYIIFGGEALALPLIKRWYKKYSENKTKLINMYGITEITVHATYNELEHSETDISIGRPLPDFNIYVLDEQGEVVPIGAKGEMYISGSRVARGYLHQPDLSTKHFLKDPFIINSEVRMYRTGDWARYRPDGNLLYLGRMDNQVKLRGYRIELAEIESNLCNYPDVKEVAVVMKNTDKKKCIVAYVVPKQGLIRPQDLREYLSNLLPDYMIPTAFVCIPELPLNINNKLDLKALPDVDNDSIAQNIYEAPQGKTEERLATVWSEILGITHIGRNDNFFALGGHSLLVIEMLGQLRQSKLITSVRAIFEAPTLSALALTTEDYHATDIPANLISLNCEQITPEMLPLIELSQSDIDTITELVPGGVSNIQDIYSLAPLQHGILFHHMMAKQGDPYLLVTYLHFSNREIVDTYVSALQQVIERHDVLRSAFVWEGLSKPAQVVWRKVSSLLSEIIPDGSTASALEQLKNKFDPSHYQVDLTKAPLLRLTILPDPSGGWIAVQLLHHLISDHYSSENLNSEVHTIMVGGKNDQNPSIPYRNLVAQAIMKNKGTEHIQFFSTMLGDIDTPTLPFGLSDVHFNMEEINEAESCVSQELNDNLRAQAQQWHVSVASLCHVAFARFLASASGRHDIVFGTVLFGRMSKQKKNEAAFGLWMNTLPFRINIDETSVEDKIQEAHGTISSLLTHEHAMLAVVQRCSRVPDSQSPFSAILNYRHNAKTTILQIPGIRILGGQERTNYPLNLSVDDDGENLMLKAQVASSVSAHRVCANMQEALSSLTNALMHRPNQSIRKVSVIPFSERDLLLKTWNEPTITYSPANFCIHDLFENQARYNGEAYAAEFNGENLSYTELNTRANQLAHFLLQKGVKPDVRVALCVSRGFNMIVGILGILKAGGAYVPLDPTYQCKRLENVLHDSDPLLLLVDADGQAALSSHQILTINLDQSLPKNLPTDNPLSVSLGLNPSHLAYVIYTSGSTGIPKGVMVEHRQISHFSNVTQKLFGFKKEDKWCLFHSFTFDASLWEMWGAFHNGSQLAIVPNDISRFGQTSYEWVCDHSINVLCLTPSYFKIFMQSKNNISRTNKLRYVILGGEALDPLILNNWDEKCAENSISFFNVYGPTETTVYSTCAELKLYKSNNSIGRPFPGVNIYLLDTLGDLVPVGADGEIYIGGAVVARGYYNRSKLTEKHFLPDQFSSTFGARMYRTGDMARYLPDGNLIYLGRLDNQVKIRGYRIELGEIESCLNKHPHVKEGVVVVRDDKNVASLIAYLVPKVEIVSPQDLREYLSTLLPDYMIPTAFVCVSTLPLTTSGKLDRKALPVPQEEAFAHEVYEGPCGDKEETLATIWKELLGVSNISRNDNFFALGGHSLLVVEMLAKLRQASLNTSVREIFEKKTLSSMATTLNIYQPIHIPINLINEDCIRITPDMLPLISLSQSDIDTIVKQVPGSVKNIQDIYSLTPLQHGILLHHLMVKKKDPSLLSTFLFFTDRVSVDRYADAIEQIVERHDILRTAFLWENLTEPVQVVWRKVTSILTEVKFDETRIKDQPESWFDLQYYQINLTKAPLLRLIIAPVSNGGWVGLLLLHHLIIDQTSLDKLQIEMQAVITGQKDSLKSPIPFRNHLVWVQKNSHSTEHIKFFRKTLADIDTPTLPFGLSTIQVDGTEINEAQCILSQELSNNLRMQAQRLHVTLASLCHLAFALFLAKTSCCKKVVFGTVLSGRSQGGEELDGTFGLWINTLPLRLDIDHTNIEDAAQETHIRLSDLLEHEHVSLAVAQRCSSVSVSSPLFSAILNFVHVQSLQQKISLPGVTIMGHRGGNNYPLAVSIEDDHDILKITALVSSISAERVCAYIQHILSSLSEALLHQRSQPVQTLSIMPLSERKFLLETLNEFDGKYSLSNCCIHQLFEAKVKTDNQSIAVIFGSQKMTYNELNVQSNRLAHLLIQQGVKPDTRVAICVERGYMMVVAILGTLKAGGAYIPLDPVYPCERLNKILEDASPICLLIDEVGQASLSTHQIPTINLDQPLPKSLPTDNPVSVDLGLKLSHLAYVIYTSGSTGVPKGVMVEHQHLTRLFDVTEDIFCFNEQDIHCLSHFSFDPSVIELWGALVYGGQLAIVPYDIKRSPEDYYEWICKSRTTVLISTASFLTSLSRAKGDSPLKDRLRYILLGGEALDLKTIQSWTKYDLEGSTVLLNLYGPTEATVMVTYCKPKTSESQVPIGRPLPDINIYLLDSYGEPVPLGIEGEIYIGGAGVARGYINQPELTEKAFLVDPFSKIPNSRMYRTGDLAYYLPDGNLIFNGRVDDQVKIRGFRINPAEIVAILVKYPQVKEVVVSVKGKGLEKYLVAYIVSNEDELKPRELRKYLEGMLPDYMIPAAFVSIPRLPFTVSGKLDHKALPDPGDDAFSREIYEAPHGEREEKLAIIWSELLGIPNIGRNDNFFALGGHSLLVIQMLAQLRKSALNTSLKEIYKLPSLSALAKTLQIYQPIYIPPNLISIDSKSITPDMLPLIALSQADINSIAKKVPGGIANIQDIYSLAPLQHGMLFHHVMAKRGDPYLLVTEMHFVDQKTLDSYTSALQLIIKRHDILRTAFVWEGISKPTQVVWREVPSILTEVTHNDASETCLEHLRRKFDPHHFQLDLTKAPLLRLMISKDLDGSWVALQLLHHMIMDHTAFECFYAEVEAIITKHSDNLMTPIPFRNLVAQTYLGVCQAEHDHFFKDMLGDIDEPTLPFNLDNIYSAGSKIDEAKYLLPSTLHSSLRFQAQRLHVSLASLCHLSFAKVLASSSGRDDVVFGTVLLGRTSEEEENKSALGLWMNTLPLRLTINKKHIEEAVYETHNKISELLAHEHAMLANAQRCSRVPDSQPLFSALLNYRHNPPTERMSSYPGISFMAFKESTNYPLTLSVDDNRDSLKITVQVTLPILASRVCAYMKEALASLNEALICELDRSMQTLSVVPQAERQLLVETWNKFPISQRMSNSCIHHLFEAQVERRGRAIAVQFENTKLTYSELNFQANQLAHFLIQLGVKPDDRVALCMTRGLTMIIAILGTWKAGSAYVPIDPTHASERSNSILKDAEPSILLVDDFGKTQLSAHKIPTINLDQPLPKNLSTSNPRVIELGLIPSHLAYIIYTSGSTGNPKAVMTEHRQIVHYITITQEVYDFNEYDKWCLFHSFAFDVSIWEIMGAFWSGSQLVILPNRISCFRQMSYEWICNSSITVFCPTPSFFKIFMQGKNDSQLVSKLRYVVFIGEPVNPHILKDWNKKNSGENTTFINMYGTTETTVVSTFYEMKYSGINDSIGRPLPEVKIYLLDECGNLVPLGANGEIYIGGTGVARGYHKRPKLTAEHYLPDPFNSTFGGRMYRTRDLAHYLPDGDLSFIGRIDRQVKVRGYRIELGEIEVCLGRHHQVQEVVVVVKGDDAEKRLLAYVVPRLREELQPNDLRKYLSSLLPEYMIPAAFICIPSVPLGVTGKIDIKALISPEDEAFVHQYYEEPQSKMEKLIAVIWSALLRVERISRHDHFFELGGNSLLAIQFSNCAKIEGVHIHTSDLFLYPTLKDLATFATSSSASFRADFAIPARRRGDQPPLFLLPTGLGDHSYGFALMHEIDSRFPVYMLPWPSPENDNSQSIEELAQRMICEIKAIQPDGTIAIAGYSSGGLLAYEIAHQLIKSPNCPHPPLFVGLFDTYPPLMKSILNDTESFLNFMFYKYSPLMEFFDKSKWVYVSEMSLSDSIQEIKNIEADLENVDIDIEREILLWEQYRKYEKMYEVYKVSPLPFTVNLFRAREFISLTDYNIHLQHKLLDSHTVQMKCFEKPNLGWETLDSAINMHVIPVNGCHITMMSDPENRAYLGRKINCLLNALIQD